MLPDNLLALWIIIIFGLINIFPIMIFASPELFIMWVIYLVVSWKITLNIAFLTMVLWSIIWENISYLLWYKWKDALKETKILKKNKDKILAFEENLIKNPIKYLFIWKLLPFTTWIIPIFAWYLKIDFKKFLIINSIMVFWWIFSISFVIYTGNNLLDTYLKTYKKEIIFFIIFVLFIFLVKKIIVKK